MDLKLVKSKDIKELQQTLKEIRENNKKLNDEWLCNKEAAAFLKMSTKTLYRFRIKGLIPFARRQKMIFFKKSDLITFMENYYRFNTQN